MNILFKGLLLAYLVFIQAEALVMPLFRTKLSRSQKKSNDLSELCFTSGEGDAIKEYLDIFDSSLKRETFVGLRLSNRKSTLIEPLNIDAMKGRKLVTQEKCISVSSPREVPINGDLVSVVGRLVNIKAGVHLQLNAKLKTNDQAKNFALNDATSELKRLIMNASFRKAHLTTENADYELSMNIDKYGNVRPSALKVKAASNIVPHISARSHDRKKNFPIETSSSFLQALKVVNKDGKPLSGMKDKLKQIERFVEILSGLVNKASSSSEQMQSKLHLTDMGSGLAYLTFAAHSYFFKEGKFADVVSVGIENRLDLVERTNKLAQKLGPTFVGLTFRHASIDELHATPTTNEEDTLKVLVALHACDTATDDAIYYGIASDCDVIVTAPCCHKQLRPQIDAVQGSSALLSYGIFRERQSEMLTDTIRAKCLEVCGYQVTVAEFVGGQHTAKNVMIGAVKIRRSQEAESAALAELRAITSTYHLHSQKLLSLLHLGDMMKPLVVKRSVMSPRIKQK